MYYLPVKKGKILTKFKIIAEYSNSKDARLHPYGNQFVLQRTNHSFFVYPHRVAHDAKTFLGHFFDHAAPDKANCSLRTIYFKDPETGMQTPVAYMVAGTKDHKKKTPTVGEKLTFNYNDAVATRHNFAIELSSQSEAHTMAARERRYRNIKSEKIVACKKRGWNLIKK